MLESLEIQNWWENDKYGDRPEDVLSVAQLLDVFHASCPRLRRVRLHSPNTGLFSAAKEAQNWNWDGNGWVQQDPTGYAEPSFWEESVFDLRERFVIVSRLSSASLTFASSTRQFWGRPSSFGALPMTNQQ
jgi:hypothetical protein